VLFSSDYPHAHFEGQNALRDGLPPALVRKMMIDNPLAGVSTPDRTSILSGNREKESAT
jgi:hypothetical protein